MLEHQYNKVEGKICTDQLQCNSDTEFKKANLHDGNGQNDKAKKTAIGFMETANMLCSKWCHKLHIQN
jgi:hypothetical protein